MTTDHDLLAAIVAAVASTGLVIIWLLVRIRDLLARIAFAFCPTDQEAVGIRSMLFGIGRQMDMLVSICGDRQPTTDIRVVLVNIEQHLDKLRSFYVDRHAE